MQTPKPAVDLFPTVVKFCKMWQKFLTKNRQDFPLTSTYAVQQKKIFVLFIFILKIRLVPY
jgi:hypothetical protein